MKKSFLTIFILAIFSLQADSQETSVTIEAPFAIDGNQYLEQARNRWHCFEEELEWLLAQSDSRDKAWIDELAKAGDYFFKLQNAILDSIASDLGETGEAFVVQASSLLQLTDWYTNYIEEAFFSKRME